VDSLSRQTRSRVMTQVRSQRNRSTEWRVRATLMRAGIRGWKLTPSSLPGKPDFVFPVERLLVFVDGCFWHGCPKCKRTPHTNVGYWGPKIQRNRERDRINNHILARGGWKVVRLWEHQLSNTGAVLRRIVSQFDV
jgi:DNA mismatch endonuclease, patch repair protein